MPTLHLLLVTAADKASSSKEPGVLLMTSAASSVPPRGTHVFSYQTCRLHAIYRELKHLITNEGNQVIQTSPLMVSMDPGLLQTLILMAYADDEAMLRLVLAYCLTVERNRCSALLRFLMAADADFLEVLYLYRLEPWPVTQYADLLSLPLRKFNQLFREKFNMSAKHWLHQQRLEHARELLETTSKKVIDVALESGFCNASHFSDSFRRHFRQSPSEVRRIGPHHISSP